jgi:hypothetical protein
MDVAFKRFQGEDREVLRMLLPDSNGLLPFEDGCIPIM